MSSQNLIDLDAAAAAVEPPQLRLGGITYTGRPLSWFEVRRIRQGLRDLALANKVSDDAMADFAKQVAAAMEFKADDGTAFDTAALLGLPRGVAWEAVQRFFSAGDGELNNAIPAPISGASSPPAASEPPKTGSA